MWSYQSSPVNEIECSSLLHTQSGRQLSKQRKQAEQTHLIKWALTGLAGLCEGFQTFQLYQAIVDIITVTRSKLAYTRHFHPFAALIYFEKEISLN